MGNNTQQKWLRVMLGFVLSRYIAADCLLPELDFPNGEIKLPALHYDAGNQIVAEELSILHFTCNAGYLLTGHEFLQCVDGEWSSEIPFCAGMKCPRPPLVQHATHVMECGVNANLVVAPLAAYYCDDKHELEDTNASALRCRWNERSRTASWEGKRPVCIEKISCPDPGVSVDGIRVGRCCRPRHVLRYYCEIGFRLVGKSRLRCYSDNTWSSERPLCRPTWNYCEFPSPIEHGVLTGQKAGDYFLAGDEARVLCDPGYKCEGKEFVVCQKGGTWKTEFGVCKEIFCDPPPPLDHGTIPELQTTNLTIFPYNFTITYVCDDGYRTNGGDSYRTCGTCGWSGKTPRCKEQNDFDSRDILRVNMEEKAFERILDLNHTGRLILYFVFDVSKSITEPNFAKSIDFAKAIVRKVGISPKGARILAVTLSSIAEIMYFPIGIDSTQDVLDALDRIEHTGKDTSYVSALRLIRLHLMPLVKEILGESKALIFLFTDGQLNVDEDPGPEAESLKAAGGKIFCFGITDKVKEEVLYDIASKSEIGGYPNVFMLQDCRTFDWPLKKITNATVGPDDFDSSAQISDILRVKLDEEDEEIPKSEEEQYWPWGNGSFPVGSMLDLNFTERTALYFCFDVSDSISLPNFITSIAFAKAIVKKVGISPDGHRAGALTFGSRVNPMFFPLHFETTEAMLEALDKIEYTDGGTEVVSVLAVISREFMVFVKHIIGDLKSVIFIFTDGKATVFKDHKEEAELLKAQGVEIYCFGITHDTREEVLYDMASTSQYGEITRPNVFMLHDCRTLSRLVREITNTTVDYSECGVAPGTDYHGRVVGGKRSRFPWPWMAALYSTAGTDDPGQQTFRCGGSAIHQLFVLTAAHCLVYRGRMLNSHEITVRLGLTNLRVQKYLQEIEVRKIYRHPMYGVNAAFDYDLALLELERPIEYNALVRPVCLPPKEIPEDSRFYKPQSIALAIGWGHERVVPKYTTLMRPVNRMILKEVALPIQPRDICMQSLQEDRLTHALTDNMFCAGETGGREDTCSGDSGGPVMQSQLNQDGHPTWFQVGIVSWGLGCGLRHEYGFYTHLQKVVEWINTTAETALERLKE